MIKYRSIFLFLFTCACVITHAQVSFVKTFCLHNQYDNTAKMIEGYDGNFIIVGDWHFDDYQNPSNSKCGALIIRIDSEGEWTWDSSYTCSNVFHDILQPKTTTSGYYIAGEGANTRESSPRLSFITNNKQIIFDSIQDLPMVQTGGIFSMCVNYKEGVIVSAAAGTPYYMNGNQCLYVQANAMNGKRLWYKYICSDYLSGIKILWNETLNQYIVFSRNLNHQFQVIRMDSVGNSIEIKQPFKGLEFDDAIQLKNGNYLVTAHNIQTMYVGLLSSTGDSLNLIRPAQESNESSYQHVTQCKDEGFVFAGIERIVRTDSAFNILWKKSLPAWTTLVSVYETKDGGYAAAGTTTANDIVCIYFIKTDSLGQVTGIKEPLKQKLSIHIYPNPANGVVQIQSSVPFAAIAVTNVMGQMILKLNEEVSSFNSSTIPSGIYFITLTDKQGSILYQQKLSILHD